MDSLKSENLAAQDWLGVLNRIFGLKVVELEFYLGVSAFVLFCFSFHMLLRTLRKPQKQRIEAEGLRAGGLSLAAVKVQRAYTLFAWASLSCGFLISLFYQTP